MNLYHCNLNCDDDDLNSVILAIVALTRGKAKAALLRSAQAAGFEVDWLTPVNIRLVEKGVAPLTVALFDSTDESSTGR